MRHEYVPNNVRRVVCAVLAVLFCCVFAASAQARNIIRWYDDEGNLHTIELSDLGPYEQQVQQEIVDSERGLVAPDDDHEAISQEALQAEKLEEQYERIKEQREQRQLRERILRQIDSTEKQIDQVTQEIQEVEHEITYKKNRQARLRTHQRLRVRLANEIEKLHYQLHLLNEKKLSLQSKKEALRQQLPPPVPSAP
ncbi:hypothetical protein DPQ33_01995 [Oceanidesulfovibrio indonesiensis]|uniref:DUF4124 domain-containing protein n=1 Tax=Oceanidesulfovibrio indonesiensis TaxID=54767 RepID=A0A7M3MJM9_9BACT|nr:hypothetical protein [Oceanidesulfovibrio indonesiensis]TVM20023.1 hypothetical protein DPQ33_01995 [Oceanidesulfovibrio indonesiensis]